MVCCALPVTLKYRFNVEGKNQMAIFSNFIYHNASKDFNENILCEYVVLHKPCY